MADEGLELAGDATAASAAAVNGPSPPSAADVVNRRVREAGLVLLHQGQLILAELVLTITITLAPREFGGATRVLINDQVRGVVVGDPALLDEFRYSVRDHVLSLQLVGYDEHDISNVFPHLLLRAAQLAAGLIPPEDDDEETGQPYSNGGFGAVPASAAAVRRLEKQTFHTATAGGNDGGVAEGGCGVTECNIRFDEFVDGAQVSVMPCPCGGHRFHPDCIAKWLGISNVCPLCRHKLPTTSAYDQ